MSEEKKVVSYKVEGSKLIIEVDPNKDGQSVLKLELDALEAFNEIGSALGKN
jgi:hypothetical protein